MKHIIEIPQPQPATMTPENAAALFRGGEKIIGYKTGNYIAILALLDETPPHATYGFVCIKSRCKPPTFVSPLPLETIRLKIQHSSPTDRLFAVDSLSEI